MGFTFMFYIFFAYAPWLALLYAAELVIVVRRRKIDCGSAFFNLFLLEGASDMVLIVSAFVGYHLNMSPFIGLFFPSRAAQIVFAIASKTIFFCNMFQKFAWVFIAFNRFTVFYFQLSHKEIWRRLFPISAVVITLSALATTWFNWVADTVHSPFITKENDTVYFGKTDFSDKPWYNTGQVTLTVHFSSATVSLLFYAATALRIRLMKKSSQGKSSGSTELRLLYYGLCQCLIDTPSCVYHFILWEFRAIATANIFTFIELAAYLVNLRALSPAVLMFIFNSRIRQQILSVVLPRRIRRSTTNTRVISSLKNIIGTTSQPPTSISTQSTTATVP